MSEISWNGLFSAYALFQIHLARRSLSLDPEVLPSLLVLHSLGMYFRSLAASLD